MAIEVTALRAEHGYVCIVLFLAILVHHLYMAFGVTSARKKYGVKYPLLYASGDDASSKTFNCVQRAHQQSLENFPQFLAVFLVAGIAYPISAAIAGLVYLAGRVVYFAGYSSGEPDKRVRGAFMYFGLLFLYGAVMTMGVKLLLGK
ncbi:hypothetical protein CVIRNUC_001863 [Coccomyxa viridis]|uniref:Glutathione S-transferase 3, mitochondrial n=1 Tax=Coccomyxa viridis TaxID=1274662 RepID=A0AAV1HXE5_9CHLO|nr:hypothetical protein CVIRNUC_001863 [Coccomyxa viridis]